MAKTRREHDSLGPVDVPADRLWGAQTQRSLENFPIGRGRFVWGRPVIRAFVTALSPHTGYEKSAEIAHTAHHHGLSLRDAALRLGHVTDAEFDAWVRAEDMTRPD